MPRVDGRRPGGCLSLIGRVQHGIVKFSRGADCAHVQFPDGETNAIAFVGCAVRVTRVRGFRHPDAQVANRHGNRAEGVRLRSALAVLDCAPGECNPRSLGGLRDGLFAGPVLHQVALGVGVGPGNANGIDRQRVRKIDDHPLRMRRVLFAGERLRQIGIAFPIGTEIAIGQAPVAGRVGAIVAGRASMRKWVAVGVAEHLAGLAAPGEIAFAAGIAPGSFRIPVPCLNVQFRVLSIRDRLPTGAQHALDGRFGEKLIDGRPRHTIDSCSQRPVRNDRVGDMVGRDIDPDGFRMQVQRCSHQAETREQAP